MMCKHTFWQVNKREDRSTIIEPAKDTLVKAFGVSD